MNADPPTNGFLIPNSLDIAMAGSAREEVLQLLKAATPENPAVVDIAPGLATVPALQILIALAKSLPAENPSLSLGPAAAAMMRTVNQVLES